MRISILFICFILFGCNNSKIDVESQQSSQKNDEYEISIRRPVFTSDEQKFITACAMVNDEITKLLDRLKYDIKGQAKDFFKLYSEDDKPAWTYQLLVEDSIFMVNDHFISVRMDVYMFTGGAHGMTTYHAFNFDVRNNKFLTDREILNYNNSVIIDALIEDNFRNPDSCFTEDPTLDLASVINFNENNVYFTYTQYTLGAYACGVAQIRVPRADLKSNFLLKL